MTQKYPVASLSFARRLDAWVGDRRLADVAPILGVSAPTVSLWLNGLMAPHRLRAGVLAAALGATEGQILTELESCRPGLPSVRAVRRRHSRRQRPSSLTRKAVL